MMRPHCLSSILELQAQRLVNAKDDAIESIKASPRTVPAAVGAWWSSRQEAQAAQQEAALAANLNVAAMASTRRTAHTCRRGCAHHPCTR